MMIAAAVLFCVVAILFGVIYQSHESTPGNATVLLSVDNVNNIIRLYVIVTL